MPIRRQFPRATIDSSHVRSGAIEPGYTKVLARLLAAHALAEKMTAAGYERALATVENQSLRTSISKNLAEERKHAALIYRLLEELGISEAVADRSMITARKGPSFDAPRFFAKHAAGEIDLLMASLSLDMTGLIMIAINYKDSSYAPHCRAAEVILEEEADHDVFAMAGLAEAVDRFGPDRMNSALREWIPRAANFFGPPGSGFTYECIRFGLKSRDNQEVAGLFLEVLGRRLKQLGLAMPLLTDSYPRALAA
jgi:1,2-phenylacetyl-CoA epoxidase catalytic subunit